MNTCERWAALLDLYVDGELGAEEMLAVQAHLDECPACRAYVDDAFAIRAAFPEAEEAQLPEGFHAHVMAAVAADAAKAKKDHSRVWKTLMPLAACFAVVLIVGRSGVMGAVKGASAESAAAAAPAAAQDVYHAAGQTAEAPTKATAEPKEAPSPGNIDPAASSPAAAAVREPGAAEEQYSVTATSDGAQTETAVNKWGMRDYFAVLHVGSEAETLDALAGREPVPLEDGTVGYELDRGEYEAFMAELSALESAAPIAADYNVDPDADTALVILPGK